MRTKFKFLPPTKEEVERYAKHLGVRMEGQRFIDYWETRGWKLTKSRPMVSWKGAVRTWKANSLKWGDGEVQKLPSRNQVKINVGYQGR